MAAKVGGVGSFVPISGSSCCSSVASDLLMSESKVSSSEVSSVEVASSSPDRVGLLKLLNLCDGAADGASEAGGCLGLALWAGVAS